ncbi:hypothetical protein, conserved [Eimeria brunetti]|uniref:Uncharacterized protein n=1 Tax=Eimeria brunetti TaxID=51314 RepID=U6LUB5_9EIME|nr:hypothetical protein, conserved [Eimeria brunetti]
MTFRRLLQALSFGTLFGYNLVIDSYYQGHPWGFGKLPSVQCSSSTGKALMRNVQQSAGKQTHASAAEKYTCSTPQILQLNAPAVACPPKGPPPGAKIAIKGNGPPPGKVAAPNPPLPGSAAAAKPGSPPKTSVGPGNGILPSKPPLDVPSGGILKPSSPLAKKELPKLPSPPSGRKAENSQVKAPLPLKSPTSPTKSVLEKVPAAMKLPVPGPPTPVGMLKPAAAKPLLPAAEGLPRGPPEPTFKGDTANDGPKTARVASDFAPSATSKGPPGTALTPKNGSADFPSAAKGLWDSQESSGSPGTAKAALGPSSSIVTKEFRGSSSLGAQLSAGLPSSSSRLLPPTEAKPGNSFKAADGAETLPSVRSPGVDEFGRQRGSVGDLAPKSELTNDLVGNVIPVFDKA